VQNSYLLSSLASSTLVSTVTVASPGFLGQRDDDACLLDARTGAALSALRRVKKARSGGGAAQCSWLSRGAAEYWRLERQVVDVDRVITGTRVARIFFRVLESAKQEGESHSTHRFVCSVIYLYAIRLYSTFSVPDLYIYVHVHRPGIGPHDCSCTPRPAFMIHLDRARAPRRRRRRRRSRRS